MTEEEDALEKLSEFNPATDIVDPSVFKDKKKQKLSQEQSHAVELCCDLTELIVGISGGAGTGKTTVLGAAYKALKTRRIATALCAPTGRAAKRVEELTKIPAKTIHRLLGYPMPDEDTDGQPIHTGPKHNRQNPLPYRAIIVDESSMLSPTLYAELLDALPKGGIIRFFGDNNQLPPIDRGIPPFIDVLNRYPNVILSFNFRSDDDIVMNAGRILRGYMPVRNDRFEIIYANNPIDALIDFVKDHKVFGTESHQIITPTRRGRYGTDRVNPSLQTRFNPRGDILKLARYADEKTRIYPAPLVVRAGDKIIWVKNDYKMEMFNGEIGKIESLDTEQGCLTLVCDGRRVLVEPRVKTYSMWHGAVIDYDPRRAIELGYAITTHKAQGSEFDVVIYCICNGHYRLLNRRNFYTAITRAKRQVILITDRKAIGYSLRQYKG